MTIVKEQGEDPIESVEDIQNEGAVKEVERLKNEFLGLPSDKERWAVLKGKGWTKAMTKEERTALAVQSKKDKAERNKIIKEAQEQIKADAKKVQQNVNENKVLQSSEFSQQGNLNTKMNPSEFSQQAKPFSLIDELKTKLNQRNKIKEAEAEKEKTKANLIAAREKLRSYPKIEEPMKLEERRKKK